MATLGIILLILILVVGMYALMINKGGSCCSGGGHGQQPSGSACCLGDSSSCSGDSKSAADSIDPVCGMTVARSSDLTAAHRGRRYLFCSEGCRQDFVDNPDKYL